MKLSREARELIELARREPSRPSDEARARMRRKVIAAVGAGALASAAGSTAAAAGSATKLGGAAASGWWASLGVSTKLGLGLLVATGAGGGAYSAWSEPEPAVAPAVVASTPAASSLRAGERPIVAAPAAASAQEPSASEPPPGPAEPPSVEPPSVESSEVAAPANDPPSAPRPPLSARALSKSPEPLPSSDAPEAPSEADALRAELALIGAAQSALGAGKPNDALASLDEHAARFPAGALSLERRALRALSLCTAGRTSEGRAEAEAFVARAPGTPLAERVSAVCR